MGMLDRVKGITPYANSGQLKPRVGAQKDTHTVRDDSGNTTGAMTERRTKREAIDKKYGAPRPGGALDTPIKIGAEYTTYHEPKSPEGKAILKDKKKSAKAIKSVNKEYSKPKAQAESAERVASYGRAKADEKSPFGSSNYGSAANYVEGGSKKEIKQHQENNRTRIQNEKDGYK
jgi:hypothetical protein